MKHEKKEKEESYYVGLGDSAIVRRSVLEAAKSVVSTISQHNRIRDLQEQKLQLRGELVRTVHHIREALQKLEKAMPEPKGDIPDLPTVGIVTRKHNFADHRLDKIEAALNEIEERMRTL